MALLLLLLAVRRLRGWDFTAGKRPTCSGIPPGLPEHQPGPCSGEDLTPREFPDDPGSCSASEKTGRARVLGDEEKEAASHLESREGRRGGGVGGGSASLRSHGRRKVWAKEDLVFPPAARPALGDGSQAWPQPGPSRADPQGCMWPPRTLHSS